MTAPAEAVRVVTEIRADETRLRRAADTDESTAARYFERGAISAATALIEAAALHRAKADQADADAQRVAAAFHVHIPAQTACDHSAGWCNDDDAQEKA